MHAGQLRHKISIQANTPTRETDGAEIPAWAEVLAPWAEMRALRGDERFVGAADQTVATLDTRFTIRYSSQVHSRQRVVYASRTFDIHAVRDPNGRGVMLFLDCQEVNP